jgi:3-phenylpropionate/trans-cinnamate dioxygenase ferredoxin subunit
MADTAEVRICGLDELIDGAARRFDVDKHRIAVVRLGDQVYAIGDRCTHQDISLSEGEVHVEECQLECWKHGSTFSLITGRPDTLPATKAVPVFPTRIDDDGVYVTVPA